MRIAKVVFSIAGLFVGMAASTASHAQHFRHGGPRVGVYLGGPAFGPRFYPSPWYYGPYGYPHTTVVVPAAPITYVESGVVQASPPMPPPPAPQVQPQGNWWYFCNDSKSFYPYVRECPTPWQLVAPQPQ